MYIERMKQIRKEKKVSQRKLAGEINYAYTQIARYETNINIPPIDYIKKFCEYFNISADYILGLTDEKRKLK